MQRGLTVIEVMITVAIIGILLTIIIPNCIAYQKKKLKETPAEDPRTETEKAKDSVDQEFEVKKLFEVDGCSVYQWRPRSFSNSRYFASCPTGRFITSL